MKHEPTANKTAPQGKHTLQWDVIELVDEYAELHSIASFLCGAMVSVMSPNMPVREDMIQGAKCCVDMLQERLQGFKEGMGKLSKRAVAESKNKG